MGRVPVYGLPILNRPDLLRNMLASFDHDVERLYIIDNGGVVKADDVKHFRANDIHIADPGYNMGVAASWNQIIKANIHADWWLIGCNDMRISPGTVARLVEDMESHSHKPHMSKVVMGNERSWGNHFGLFALNAEAIDMTGWFDENLYPIYFEDNDYMDRIKRAEQHGFTTTVLDSTTNHQGNASWKDDTHNAAGNQRSWDLNGPYYHQKWRTSVREFAYPFDIGETSGAVRELDGLRYFPQPRIADIRKRDWNIRRSDNVKNKGHF